MPWISESEYPRSSDEVWRSRTAPGMRGAATQAHTWKETTRLSNRLRDDCRPWRTDCRALIRVLPATLQSGLQRQDFGKGTSWGSKELANTWELLAEPGAKFKAAAGGGIMGNLAWPAAVHHWQALHVRRYSGRGG
jgi:hypothetical protein